ncbi:hypothetical protein D6792_01655 [Candidatus Parcubacteria bacterium]|nr:MAG: hypothetical protein D6792_01655 [Candidatus Parcubacteria bacterium]
MALSFSISLKKQAPIYLAAGLAIALGWGVPHWEQSGVFPPPLNMYSVPKTALAVSPACVTYQNVLVELQALRERVEVAQTTEEIQVLSQTFANILARLHDPRNVDLSDPTELERERQQLLDRIAWLRSLDTSGKFSVELDSLEAQVRTAKSIGDLIPIQDRLLIIEIALRTGGKKNTGGGNPECEDAQCNPPRNDDTNPTNPGNANQGSNILTGFKPRISFTLPGNGEDNVRSRVWIAFRKGESLPYFVQHNALRLLRVFTPYGNMLWEYYQPKQIDNTNPNWPELNVHHSDGRTFDIDGDGTDEIIACGAGIPGGSPDKVEMRIYDLLTGTVRARYDLSSEPGLERPVDYHRMCEFDLVLFEGETAPYAIMATKGPNGKMPGYMDVYSRTIALRLSPWKIEKLWTASTHQAGHSVWPYDANRNGKAEFMWVGKYKIDKYGNILATPTGGSGWVENEDHWDGVQIADLIPSRPGLEMAVVGGLGTEIRDAEDGTLVYRFEGPSFVDVQRAVVGDFVPEDSGLEIYLEQMRQPRDGSLVGPTGKVYWIHSPRGPSAYQLARLVNGREVMQLWGEAYAIDKNGFTRVLEGGGAWFGESIFSNKEIPGMLMWNPDGWAMDLWGDAREEVLTWGRNRLVVGSFEEPTQSRLKEHEPFYWLRLKMIANFTRTVAPNPELAPW